MGLNVHWESSCAAQGVGIWEKLGREGDTGPLKKKVGMLGFRPYSGLPVIWQNDPGSTLATPES